MALSPNELKLQAAKIIVKLTNPRVESEKRSFEDTDGKDDNGPKRAKVTPMPIVQITSCLPLRRPATTNQLSSGPHLEMEEGKRAEIETVVPVPPREGISILEMKRMPKDQLMLLNGKDVYRFAYFQRTMTRNLATIKEHIFKESPKGRTKIGFTSAPYVNMLPEDLRVLIGEISTTIRVWGFRTFISGNVLDIHW